MRTLIIAVTILMPAAASAGGYLVPSSAPREVGLGEAAIAAQDGPEAVLLNSAAMARQEGLAAGFGGEILNNRTDWSDSNLGSASQSQITTPVAVAVTYGAKLDGGMAWGAGIGLGVPAGGALAWPKGWAGQEFVLSVKQQIFGFGGGVAFQPLPFLRLGATYVRFQVAEEIHQSVNFLDHFADAGIAMSGGANSFGVAAELQVPTVPLTFGVTYNHSAEIPLEGDAHFTGVPPAFQTLLHDQAVTEKVVMPNVFRFGAAYEAMPGLKVMASYEFERWSIYKSDVFIGEGDFMVTVPRNYNNAHVIRTGGEYARLPFMQELTLRAGVLRSISNQPKDTLSPSLTDAGSWAVSIGGGYNVMPNLRIDLAYQHAFFDKVTATGTEALPGSYTTNVDVVSVGVGWRTDLGAGDHGK
jgi:long-subunit fatty acid transport protein